MKIARKVPVAQKCPVRINDTKYALYSLKPVLLGEIVREGNYWYTADGMRFVSSRNALDYLQRIRDMVEQELALELKYKEKVMQKIIRDTRPEVRTVRRTTNASSPSSGARSQSVVTKPVAPVNDEQNERRHLDTILRNLGYIRNPDTHKDN